MRLYIGQLNAFWIDLYPDDANFQLFWANISNNFRQDVPNDHCKIALSTGGLKLQAAWMAAITNSFEKLTCGLGCWCPLRERCAGDIAEGPQH
eukprot:3642669-Amphidinium_carterae.1